MHSLDNLPVIPLEFYSGSPVTVARELLGQVLVHSAEEGPVAGRIVECEAYTGPEDPASHASRGRTPRNAVMFGPPGMAYVYFNYGMHYLFNIVTSQPGEAGAVLVRAVEPLAGLEFMMRRRGKADPLDLCSGPGKLTQAFGIGLEQNGVELISGSLTVRFARKVPPGEISVSPRIGISAGTDELWRFFLAGSPHVSHPRASSSKVSAQVLA